MAILRLSTGHKLLRAHKAIENNTRRELSAEDCDRHACLQGSPWSPRYSYRLGRWLRLSTILSPRLSFVWWWPRRRTIPENHWEAWGAFDAGKLPQEYRCYISAGPDNGVKIPAWRQTALPEVDFQTHRQDLHWISEAEWQPFHFVHRLRLYSRQSLHPEFHVWDGKRHLHMMHCAGLELCGALKVRTIGFPWIWHANIH